VVKVGRHPPLEEAPLPTATHFDIGPNAKPPLQEAFKTFSDIQPDTLPPGTIIYRVLDPKSNDNNICWMSAQEFRQLRSKAEWRRRFAVWGHWNSNGEFVTYTVPPGPGLPVWRGKTASQRLENDAGQIVQADNKGNNFWLEGGAEQLVLNPKHLSQQHLGPREFTGWGYDEFGQEAGLIGVPILQHHWRP
ncbi:MAG TPA: hypothetical protein VIG85_05725, partial [Comamonas sp.]